MLGAPVGTLQGTVVVAEDLTASSVEVSVETAAINTLNPVHGDDLRSEHYLDVAQYPAMTFQSTAVAESAAGVWHDPSCAVWGGPICAASPPSGAMV